MHSQPTAVRRIERECQEWKSLPSVAHPEVEFVALKTGTTTSIVKTGIIVKSFRIGESESCIQIELTINEDYPFKPPFEIRFTGPDLPPPDTLLQFKEQVQKTWSPSKTMLSIIGAFARIIGDLNAESISQEETINRSAHGEAKVDDIDERKVQTESEGWRRVELKNSASRLKLGLNESEWIPQTPLPESPLESQGLGLLGDAFPSKETGSGRVPGGIYAHDVISANDAAKLVRCAELLHFDNHSHPAYQSQNIDKDEQGYRRNDRCVYQASEEENFWLFSNVRKYFQHKKKVYFDEKGTVFNLWGTNDMWRFYKYGDVDQEFPIHFDNMTVKTRSLLSLFSVLIYLTDDFDGGETVFHAGVDPRSQNLRFDHSEIAVVKPTVGTMVAFSHFGFNGAMHSGAKYKGGRTPKYVLRTDVFYEAETRCPTTGATQLSAPYNSPGFLYEYPRHRVMQLLRQAVRDGRLPASLLTERRSGPPAVDNEQNQGSSESASPGTDDEKIHEGLAEAALRGMGTASVSRSEAPQSDEKIGTSYTLSVAVAESLPSAPDQSRELLPSAISEDYFSTAISDASTGTTSLAATAAAAAVGDDLTPATHHAVDREGAGTSRPSLADVVAWAQHWLSRGAGSEDILRLLEICDL